MLNIKRKLTPVQRKPRNMKTITKKIRKKQLPQLGASVKRSVNAPDMTVKDHGWSNSDISPSFAKLG